MAKVFFHEPIQFNAAVSRMIELFPDNNNVLRTICYFIADLDRSPSPLLSCNIAMYYTNSSTEQIVVLVDGQCMRKLAIADFRSSVVEVLNSFSHNLNINLTADDFCEGLIAVVSVDTHGVFQPESTNEFIQETIRDQFRRFLEDNCAILNNIMTRASAINNARNQLS